MSTTLPLFWHLSSASKKERIDASVKLVSALEHFQAQFTPDEENESNEEEEREKGDGLDRLNAQDVSYSIRRLVRGLASPRESSRLGFAVALTELLSRITTVTCTQITSLILSSTQTGGSMTGQEERDTLFARLFGLTAVVRSGLLVRTTPLEPSASSAPEPASAASFGEVVRLLRELGERKAWLRESAGWAVGVAVDKLAASSVPWKDEAFDAAIQSVFVEEKSWNPEKVAIALKLQKYCPEREWGKILGGTFKHSRVVHTGNYAALARILKDTQEEDEEEGRKAKAGAWKPQVHCVWDALLDEVLAPDAADASFPEFFRILVDESLFSAAASNERKYWGFQIFQKALPRVGPADVPMLFTKNFMRSWINHLSHADRYLHKIAKHVASDITNAVKKNPALGFTLILQLTGVNGSQNFDRLTRTKTVETILASMHTEGIEAYIRYLLDQLSDEPSAPSDTQALNARRAWIVEQLAALVRNGAIPKDDAWVQAVLDWFTVHGLFSIAKPAAKSPFAAVREVPRPVFSEGLRRACRERLLSSLAELTGHATVIKTDDKTAKIAAVAADGQFWISRVLATIEALEKDTKHVSLLSEADADELALRAKARALIERLKKVEGEQQDAARGAVLLVSATLLHQYCVDDDDEDGAEALESCIDGASRLFPAESSSGKKGKKARKAAVAEGEEEEAPEPVDVLVDTVIGFLEKGTAYLRAVANQVFALLTGAVRESTVELILAQLERREPEELLEDEEGMEDGEGEESGVGEDEPSEEDDEEEEEEEEDLDEEADPELRRKIEEALAVNGIQAATADSDDESEEELMDDDQMMAIDEQLAAVFKARADEKKLGKGVDAQREATHYKNRVLDLLDTFIKKQPTSPFIVRLVLPLIELVVGTGPDEKQLADKAIGILRARVGKFKEVPASLDAEATAAVLAEIHTRARKAATGDVLATLSQCGLYVSRCLLHAGAADAVRDAYQGSLVDFGTRKASRLSAGFLQDFVRRYAETAWAFRDVFLDTIRQAVNGYRQVQVFQLVQVMLAQRPSTGINVEEAVTFSRALCTTMQECIKSACEDGKLNAAQIKDVLKLALAGVRHTKRVTDDAAVTRATWDPAGWDALAAALAGAERFRASAGLQTLCKQVSTLANKEAGEGAKSKKRKVDEAVDAAEPEAAESTEATKKPKRKKQRATKT